MGNLPEYRIKESPPFKHTGIDYAGPIRLKACGSAKNTTISGYIAIFVCMVTRAVHIEVVSSLKTDAFISAFNRFQARRGNCTNLYSDNAGTFIGSANKLEQIHNSWTSDTTIKELSTKGIKWTFITPKAPHQGGIWEAAIKSAKHHMHRVTKSALLTFEEFTTVMAQIEACLNSRPLYALSDDPADQRVITPADIIGSGPILTPLVNREVLEKVNLTNKYRFMEGMVNDFWQKWKLDYISSLQNLHKWRKPKENLKINDMVLVIDENLAPANWSLGKISKVYADKQGLVRKVTVKTACGNISRAVQQLVWIPVESNGGEC